MQVARLLEPRAERSFTREAAPDGARASNSSVALSKDEILALYLSLAPYGGNLEGVRAASLAYFGKEPRRLTLGEAALLVALPQSPEQRRPDRSGEAARRARDRVLDRLAAAGARAGGRGIERARARAGAGGTQAHADAGAARGRRGGRGGAGSQPSPPHHRRGAAAKSRGACARARPCARTRDLGRDPRGRSCDSGEVLARVASADYFDIRRAGQVDMTAAVRSPGSTLKPFIYGLGFEDGLIHPDTLIEDRPIRFGGYAPENFDLTFQGTVTVRRALQLSLNVPAVAVLDKVGASRFAARLEQAGASFALPQGEVPGLAMGLGGVGVKLARSGCALCRARAARHDGAADRARRPMRRRRRRRAGCWMRPPPGTWATSCSARRRRRTPPAGASPSRPAPPMDIATPGRWASTASARSASGSAGPMARRCPAWSGAVAAAPILFDAFARTGKLPAPLPPRPRACWLRRPAKLPPPLQRFRPAGSWPTAGEPQLRIMFPPNGARLELASDGAGKPDPIALKVTGAPAPLTVLVNGLPLAAGARHGARCSSSRKGPVSCGSR